ncbi:MAG TPA: 4,5-DOPA dioxygenase extradiol [bacterium]|nr:4,5-DOPA dioxygenase extradiol [bacterium]
MSTLPALFVGHGSPLNAIADNDYTRALHAWGGRLQALHPQAVLCVSAHWWTPGTRVTVAERPQTIHDFSGFPPELHRMTYPCPGAPELAARVQALYEPGRVQADAGWGLDHGAWAVLHHLFPQADVPTVQLSLDGRLSAQEHWELGRRLRPLREEGVLILGSGNVVHSFVGARSGNGTPQPWAQAFDAHVKTAILAGDHAALIHYEGFGNAAQLSVPTPEHYLPLLYTLSVRGPGEPVAFPFEGIQMGSMSMRSVQVG